MRFGPVEITEAEGCVLAHSTYTSNGRMRKGRRLSAPDIAQLKAAGHSSVIVAKLDPDDVEEDQAAADIASRMAGENVRVAEAFTGRANMFARADGVFDCDRDWLIALNRVDEGLTVATLPPFSRVTSGQIIATVKIIPFALPSSVMDSARALLDDNTSCIRVAAFQPHRAGLVVTQLPGTKSSVLEKRIRAIGDRVVEAGSTIEAQKVVAHNRDAVCAAASELSGLGADPILIFGASAIVDRDDVVPGGVVDAGGTIIHLGMPVDPGNLLLFAKLNGATVIGVPSCASSPKTNGLDWVLERTLSGLTLTRDEITSMAAGGLLMEIPSRPQPRQQSLRNSKDRDPRRAPNVTAVVLASGQSRRMGARNKLLEDFRGKPLVRYAVEAASASTANHVVVVTGYDEEPIRRALEGITITFAHNDRYEAGLATSLVRGISAVPKESDGVLILLGDMPLVAASLIDKMIAAFAPDDGRGICVPIYNGRRGNPVLWSSAYFATLAQLRGDIGARHLLSEYVEDVAEVAVDTDAIFADIDTPEALAELRGASDR
ncbi:MAG: NTP transferase domain-containing protein [Hyphomicrobiaceae bacterium]